jgi:hypothetical protein
MSSPPRTRRFTATLCLETHESRHDRSHGVPRSHVIEARCGTRCHPQGRERSLSALMSVCNVGSWRHKTDMARFPIRVRYAWKPAGQRAQVISGA